jgi:uncharacterized protein YdeI (YjbR/CyaY-like superfamily)
VDDALTFENVDQWDAWLAEHHGEPGGAWLRVRKKASTQPAITAPEAGDVALCYGWIDSIRRSLDADYFLQKYSPRRPGGSWSKVNVERAEALIAAGRMRTPGLTEIEAAQADGRWAAAYESQRTATVPPDLQAALRENERARIAFERLGRTAQYLAYLPLLKSRTPRARQALLANLIRDLST